MVDINRDELYNKENDNIGAKINPRPMPETQIGIDTDNEFFYDLATAGESSSVDITSLNSFLQLSQNRETLYQVLDTMAQDSTISAVLEIYAEDATETNEQGKIVWVESSQPEVAKCVTSMLNNLNIDKHIYRWVYSLCKYGDLYLKLYRRSDIEDDLFSKEDKDELNDKFTSLDNNVNTTKSLHEDIVVKTYESSDKLVEYVEMVPNPGEMFELTKFGKSYAYLKTNQPPSAEQQSVSPVLSSYYLYKMRKRDLEVYNAVSFVHAALTDDTPRLPEQVQIFNTNDFEKEDAYVYTVNRGQSVLYSSYKIWRQMMLLENALLLNRLTKSSILRVLEIEVGDMPKERVQPYLQRIKALVEQKTSIDTGDRMSEYVNPGAMENNVYVPTRNGQGAIQTQQIGGDVNVRDVADIDYFKNKLYGSLKIPKMFLGDTDDSAGFNGGTSLSIISSRYAKTVKRIQTTVCQMLTDLINILLLDRKLDAYVNKFKLHMQPPVTQEEIDKKSNISSEIQITDDIMRIVGDIEDPVIKLKILKSLLSNAISNQEVIELIQQTIDDLEKEVEDDLNNVNDLGDMEDDFGGGGTSGGGDFNFDDFDLGGDTTGDDFADLEAGTEEGAGEELPTPADLDAGDFTET